VAPPTALNVGRWGASIELSEVCSSVGQLEARAGEGLALAPLTESAVMGLPASVGVAEGCRHFFTNGGLYRLGGPALPHRVVDPALPRPLPGVEAFSFLAFPELGRCHKNKPQAVYACLGFGGVCCN
jgi:hypothetical protein